MFLRRKLAACMFVGLLGPTMLATPSNGFAASAPQVHSLHPSKKQGTQRAANSVVYSNKEYGFRFYLPKSWKGYSIVPPPVRGDGAIIRIRHPNWTLAEPREDIPIQVFTRTQWPSIQDGTRSVSAAPFPPSELGRNAKYVFALPARYNYDFSLGYEEVEKILKGNPLHAF